MFEKNNPLSKYNLSVCLKQHTSLIVEYKELEFFLRSTELRPKLNTFLKNQYKSKFKDKAIPEEWLIGDKPENANTEEPEPRALDFRIRDMVYCDFTIEDKTFQNKDKSWTKEIKVYTHKELEPDSEISVNGSKSEKFANLAKDTLFYKRWAKDAKITFTIHCKIPTLITFIKEHVEMFFILSNFGRAQSKGYGQFTVESINGNHEGLKYNNDLSSITNLLKCSLAIENTIFEWQPNEEHKTKYSIQKDIHTFYAILKKGMTHGEYEKSLLYKYFETQDGFKGWEKKAAKQSLVNEDLDFFNKYVRFEPENAKKNPEVGQEINQWFIRALLGLPENYEFLLNRNDFYKSLLFDVKHEEGEIEQFPSTIQWKLFIKTDGNYRVFLIPRDIKDKKGDPVTITDKTFGFETKLKDKDPSKVDKGNPTHPEIRNNNFSINTPNDFDLIRFLDFVCTYTNNPGNEKNLNKGHLKKVPNE